MRKRHRQSLAENKDQILRVAAEIEALSSAQHPRDPIVVRRLEELYALKRQLRAKVLS